ncbi:class I SAM-dependent methyltransferase [Maricaulaceae bacterium MS644]
MTSDSDELRPLAMLAARLRERIAAEGPLSVAAFMGEALFDPIAGFYATKDPLSAASDFITAPEISQMFGELLGLWTAEVWGQMGAPAPVQLIELGPGTGRMMSDMLRAGRAMPGFLEACDVTLVEASPALKMVQGETLSRAPVPVRWARQLEQAAKGPCVIVSNEFLDCLPIRQGVRLDGRWRERVVGLDPKDPARFAFGLGSVLSEADIETLPEALRAAPDGTLVELRPGDPPLVEAVAARLHAAPGYALFIDYGSDAPEFGDTLQAIRKHEKVDPLDRPGGADLTAWAAFDRLGALAQAEGLDVYGPNAQGAFLTGLGIEQRAAALARTAGEAGRGRLMRQLERLTSSDEMGDLFKVMAFASPGLAPPPGLDPLTAR